MSNTSAQSCTPPRSNATWLLDIGYPSAHGRRFSVLCIVEQLSGACLAMEIQETFHLHDVVRVLDRLASARGAPDALMVHGNALFNDATIVRWATSCGAQLVRPSVRAPSGKGPIERAIRSARAGLSPPGSDKKARRERYDA